MSPETLTDLWRAGGASVRGANHARAALPNQDALRWLPAPGALICALSDGHGSDKSFRSDLGALFAVQTALTVIQDTLLESVPANPAALAERLPHIIVDAWRQAVECHLAEAPFTDAEWARLSAKDGDGARQRVEAKRNWWLAYGATFLLCVVTPGFILYAQLGDGDILLVSQDGSVARPNWQADPRLFANETTSLCMPEAWGRDAGRCSTHRRTCWRARARCPAGLLTRAHPARHGWLCQLVRGRKRLCAGGQRFARDGPDRRLRDRLRGTACLAGRNVAAGQRRRYHGRAGLSHADGYDSPAAAVDQLEPDGDPADA